MTRSSAPFFTYILSAFVCFSMATSACSHLKAEGHDAQAAVVNCTAQEIGTTPALNLATLVAIANVVAAEKTKCTRDGVLDYDCVEVDLISEGEILGGCAFVHLIAAPSEPTVVALSTAAPPAAEPWRVQFERFRAKIANGAKYHLADGDH